MFTVKANDVPLKNFRITQDENGPYHKNLTYAGVLQHPLDFGGLAVGTRISIDTSCTVVTRSSGEGNYITVNPKGTNIHLVLVHVYQHVGGAGTYVKAGVPIGKIAPASANGGYAPHLHIAALQYISGKYSEYWVRNIIFNASTNFVKGDYIQFTTDTNIRTGPGTNYNKQKTAKAGENTFQIIGGPRSGSGYTWYDVLELGGGTGWAIDKYMKKVDKPEEPEPPEEPEVPCHKYILRIGVLEKELEECQNSRKKTEGKLDKSRKLYSDFKKKYEEARKSDDKVAGNILTSLIDKLKR